MAIKTNGAAKAGIGVQVRQSLRHKAERVQIA